MLGSLSSNKLRGDDKNSYNVYEITEDTIRYFLIKLMEKGFYLENIREIAFS